MAMAKMTGGKGRSTIVALSALFAFVVTSVSVYALAAAPSGSLKIAKLGKKKAVSFDHAKHIAAGFYPSCKKCHHKSEGEPAGAAAKCTGCHTEPATDEAIPSAKKAMHKACKSCHKKRDREGLTPNGPTTCAGCHAG